MKELGEHRQLTSLSSNIHHLEDKLKACTDEEEQLIQSDLQKGGFQVAVSTNQAVAMKADLGIPWSKLRTI